MMAKRSTLLCALLGTQALAGVYDGWQRESEEVLYTVVSGESFVWQLGLRTIYRQLEGDSYLRITNYVTGVDIMADDIVEFTMNFYDSGQATADVYLDSAKCMMVQNSADTRLWDQYTDDGFYT